MIKIINVMGLFIEIEASYEMLKKRIEKYTVSEYPKIDFKIQISQSRLDELKNEYPHLSYEELEYIFTGQAFYINILKYDGFLLHSSSVVVDNFAYSFSANSGVGKSTHTSLYLKHFEGSYIINDDKPAYRKEDGKWYVYGTPWSGKYDLSKNEKAELMGICFIKRGTSNKTRKLDSLEAIEKILNQTIRPKGFNNMDSLFKILNDLITDKNIYEIECDISDSAVISSYNALRNGIYEN